MRRGNSWRRAGAHGRDEAHKRHASRARLWARLATLGLLGGVALALLGLLGGGIETAQARSRAASSGSLDIVNPAPANGAASGPVGATITVQGKLAPSNTYQLGYAPQNIGCISGFTLIPGASGVSDASGALPLAFTWPAAANAVGASYYVCAKNASDPGEPVTQSNETYTVLASGAPAITSVQGQAPTAAGASTPTPSDTLHVGDTVILNGANFYPADAPLAAFISSAQLNAGQWRTAVANQQATQLQPANGQPLVSGSDGSAQAVVSLPAAVKRGTYYFYLVSQENSPAPPALLAISNQKNIGAKPTPSPTATTGVTPSPSVATTPSAGSGGGTSTPGAPNGDNTSSNHGIIALGLGGLSLLLLVIGVIFLASAASLPTQRP